MDKPILVYFNPDCFADTDVTVLGHLTKEFRVVWFYFYESLQAKSMRYNPEFVKSYAAKYGIVLEIVDPQIRRRNPGTIMFYRRVAKKINNYRPDLVYSCDFLFWTFCRSIINTPNRVYGIHDAAAHSSSCNIYNEIIGVLSKKCRKRMNHFLTFSMNQHDLFKEKYGKESYMVGMSCKSFGISELKPDIFEKGIRILFFGSISMYKGLDILVDALEDLYSNGINNICLTIAGKGAFWEECKSRIKTPDMYNLQIRFIDNAEIPDIMATHHFLVLPYRDATQSGPLLTALNYSLPIIAPNFGCFSETYNNKTAILYQPGELLQGLKKVSNLTSADYIGMKCAVSSLRQNFTEEKIADNYINAFKKVILKTTTISD